MKTNQPEQDEGRCFTVERCNCIGDIIWDWLKDEPLSFDSDDFVYLKIVDNHIEVGRVEIIQKP